MAEDKVNIGLTTEANAIVDMIEEIGLFEDRLSVAKFALAYIIKNEKEPDFSEYRIGETSGTKWNIGSVDNDQSLREIVISLYPEVETPYRYIEILMNEGLLILGDIISKEGITKISKLM